MPEEGLGQLAVSVIGDIKTLIEALKTGKDKVRDFVTEVNKDLSSVETKLKNLGASTTTKTGGRKSGGKSAANDEIREKERILGLEAKLFKEQGRLVEAQEKLQQKALSVANRLKRSRDEILKTEELFAEKIASAREKMRKAMSEVGTTDTERLREAERLKEANRKSRQQSIDEQSKDDARRLQEAERLKEANRKSQANADREVSRDDARRLKEREKREQTAARFSQDSQIRTLQNQADALRSQKKLIESADIEGQRRLLVAQKRGASPAEIASIHTRNAEAIRRARVEQIKLTNSTEETGQAISRITGMIQRMIGAFVIYKLVDGFQAVIRAGLEFNAIMEGTQAGIAGLLISVKNYVDITTGEAVNTTRAYGAALVEAAQNMKLLQQVNLETAATLPEILTQYQQLIATMGGVKGATPEALTALTKRFSILGQMFMIPQQQMMEEIRSATTGAMKPGLTRILPFFVGQFSKMGLQGTPNEIIRSWRSQGIEMEKLLELLKPMEAIAKKLQGTWAVAISNLKDLAEMLLGEGFKPLFEYIRDNVNIITEALKDPKEREKLLAGLRGINTALVDMVNNAKIIGSLLFSGLTILGEWPLRVAGMVAQVIVFGVAIKGLTLLFSLLKNAFKITAAEGAGFFAKFGGLWISLAVTGLLEIIQHWDWLSQTIKNAKNALSDFFLLNRIPGSNWLKNFLSPPTISGPVGRNFPSTSEEFKRKRAAAGMPVLEDDPDTKRLKEEVARSLTGNVFGIPVPTHEDLELEKEINEWRIKRLQLHKLEIQALEQERDATLKLITDEKVRAEAAKYYQDLIEETKIRTQREIREMELETQNIRRRTLKPEDELTEKELLQEKINTINQKRKIDLEDERWHRNNADVLSNINTQANTKIEFEKAESQRRIVKLALNAAHDEMEIERRKAETKITLGEIASSARIVQIQQEIAQTKALLERQDLQPSQRREETKRLAELEQELPKTRMEVRQEAFDRLQTIFDTEQAEVEEQISLEEKQRDAMVKLLDDQIARWKELVDTIGTATFSVKEQEENAKKLAQLEAQRAKVSKQAKRENIDLEKQKSQLILERSRFEMSQGIIDRPTFLKRLKDQIDVLEAEKTGKSPQQVLQIEREILGLQQEYAGLTVNIWAEAQNSISQGFMSILDGTQKFGDGLIGFFKNLTRKIVQIMVDDLAHEIVKVIKGTFEQIQTETNKPTEGTKSIFSGLKGLFGMFGGTSFLQSPDGQQRGIPRPDQPQDQMGQMTTASGGIGKLLGNFGIGSGIGSAMGGITGGNPMGSMIGGGIGSVLGTKLGAMLGSWGGPIGMGVGAVAGSLLGGLFGGGKKKKDPIRAAIRDWWISTAKPALEELKSLGFGQGIFEGMTGSAFVKNLGWGKGIPQAAIEAMKSAAESLKDALSDAIEASFKAGTARSGWQVFLRNIRRGLADYVTQGLIDGILKGKALTELFAPIYETVSTAITKAIQFARTKGEKGTAFDPKAFQQLIMKEWGKITPVLGSLEPLLASIFTVSKDFQRNIAQRGTGIWEGLPSGVLSGLLGDIKPAQAHTGGIVTQSGLIDVQKGEEILSKRQNKSSNLENIKNLFSNFLYGFSNIPQEQKNIQNINLQGQNKSSNLENIKNLFSNFLYGFSKVLQEQNNVQNITPQILNSIMANVRKAHTGGIVTQSGLINVQKGEEIRSSNRGNSNINAPVTVYANVATPMDAVKTGTGIAWGLKQELRGAF